MGGYGGVLGGKRKPRPMWTVSFRSRRSESEVEDQKTKERGGFEKSTRPPPLSSFFFFISRVSNVKRELAYTTEGKKKKNL